jgi:hypothetical protein
VACAIQQKCGARRKTNHRSRTGAKATNIRGANPEEIGVHFSGGARLLGDSSKRNERASERASLFAEKFKDA